jgi:hypothetical protein
MRIARTCDDRSSELKDQHANALRVKEMTIAKLEDAAAGNAVIVGDVRAENATLKAENMSLKVENGALKAEVATLKANVTASQARAMSKLTDIHTAVAALHTLLPPLPPLLLLAPVTFDRSWCAAACGTTWKVDIDATGTRAHVKQADEGWVTLRSAASLPRPFSTFAAADKRQQLPAYRVVVEAYGSAAWFGLGFLPSHHVRGGAGSAAAVIPVPVQSNAIFKYGGWCVHVCEWAADPSIQGWMALEPQGVASRGTGDLSTYATTSQAPPVPPGGAVEFAVDYVAGTCRVAFYTPAAVAGGFVEAPHAKMELRFVASEAMVPYNARFPGRPIPTLADGGVELYPAVCISQRGAICRFV